MTPINRTTDAKTGVFRLPQQRVALYKEPGKIAQLLLELFGGSDTLLAESCWQGRQEQAPA